MLGYNYIVKRLDSEIEKKLESTPYRFWGDEETELSRSLTLASWKTALYPEWPKKLVAEGLVTVYGSDTEGRRRAVVSAYEWLLPFKRRQAIDPSSHSRRSSMVWLLIRSWALVRASASILMLPSGLLGDAAASYGGGSKVL